ncbi:hypothetical protein [Hanstruepera marina]|uniref:hypothetical protein n=1 Tax=Hanstruepera marina TaxID=2873265 RepID=UPI00210672C0|nr:hypothetical protein [Hanstruepera marina]
MNKTAHQIYVGTLVSIVVFTTIYLAYNGYSYYSTALEERFYHPKHNWFKPSGLFGQGLGVFGTLMMLIGVSVYILHKRYNILGRHVRLKYLLEFHIFLCTLGPILILFHTAFKFGGIVSIAFWSMVAVVASGVIGRFIYIQIPRTIEGRALSLSEVQNMKTDIAHVLREDYQVDEADINLFVNYTTDKTIKRSIIKQVIKNNNLSKTDSKTLLKMLQGERSLSKKITRLETMKQYFKYWHVAHMPFALIMLVIVIIHIVVAFTFGYKWIF